MTSSENTLNLESWSSAKMDNENRLQLSSLDNPGWSLVFNLRGTQLENEPFKKIKIDRSSTNWIYCSTSDQEFKLYCGPSNLLESIDILQSWVKNFYKKCIFPTDSHKLLWLQDWFISNCDGDWEHSSGINLTLSDKTGWMLSIDLTGTSLENRSFEKLEQYLTDGSQVMCKVTNEQFLGKSTANHLSALIEIFIDWAEKNSN